jgi:hypothetical protein
VPPGPIEAEHLGDVSDIPGLSPRGDDLRLLVARDAARLRRGNWLSQ